MACCKKGGWEAAASAELLCLAGSAALCGCVTAPALGLPGRTASGCFCGWIPLLEASAGGDNVGKGLMAAADGGCCGSSAAAVDGDALEARTIGGLSPAAAKKSSASSSTCDDDPKVAKGMAAAAVDAAAESLRVASVVSLTAVDTLGVASVASMSAVDMLSAAKGESENIEGGCCW